MYNEEERKYEQGVGAEDHDQQNEGNPTSPSPFPPLLVFVYESFTKNGKTDLKERGGELCLRDSPANMEKKKSIGNSKNLKKSTKKQ